MLAVKRATEVTEPGAVVTGSQTQLEWQYPVATAPGSVPNLTPHGLHQFTTIISTRGLPLCEPA